MNAVTGLGDVLTLAEKIVKVCREHTSNETVAMTIVQIAERLIFSEWVCSQSAMEHSLSAEAPKRFEQAT